MTEKLIKKNHILHMAGKVWVFDEVEFIRDIEGDLSITAKELLRLQRAVGNAVCGSSSFLTTDELDFLCEATSTTGKEISTVLFCDSSSVAKWRNQSKVPMLESVILKEYFWVKIFGEGIVTQIDLFGPKRLDRLCRKAIEDHLADPVSNKAA